MIISRIRYVAYLLFKSFRVNLTSKSEISLLDRYS